MIVTEASRIIGQEKEIVNIHEVTETLVRTASEDLTDKCHHSWLIMQDIVLISLRLPSVQFSYAVLGWRPFCVHCFLTEAVIFLEAAILITLLLSLSKPGAAPWQSVRRDLKYLQLPLETSRGIGPGQIFDLPSENKWKITICSTQSPPRCSFWSPTQSYIPLTSGLV